MLAESGSVTSVVVMLWIAKGEGKDRVQDQYGLNCLPIIVVVITTPTPAEGSLDATNDFEMLTADGGKSLDRTLSLAQLPGRTSPPF